MKRLKLLGIAILAIFALGAIAAATASAENVEILPTPTKAEPLEFKSVNVKEVKSILTGEKAGSAIECEESTSTGEMTSTNLGVGEIDFHGCKSELNGSKCSSLGDEGGLILLPIDWHAVDVLLPAGEPAPELMLGFVAILLELLHVECGTLLILVGAAVIGEFGQFTKSGALTKSGTILFAESTKGVQKVKECDLDKAFCSGKTFGLYIELGKGREKGGETSEDEVTLEATTKFKEGAAFDY